MFYTILFTYFYNNNLSIKIFNKLPIYCKFLIGCNLTYFIHFYSCFHFHSYLIRKKKYYSVLILFIKTIFNHFISTNIICYIYHYFILVILSCDTIMCDTIFVILSCDIILIVLSCVILYLWYYFDSTIMCDTIFVILSCDIILIVLSCVILYLWYYHAILFW